MHYTLVNPEEEHTVHVESAAVQSAVEEFLRAQLYFHQNKCSEAFSAQISPFRFQRNGHLRTSCHHLLLTPTCFLATMRFESDFDGLPPWHGNGLILVFRLAKHPWKLNRIIRYRNYIDGNLGRLWNTGEEHQDPMLRELATIVFA